MITESWGPARPKFQLADSAHSYRRVLRKATHVKVHYDRAMPKKYHPGKTLRLKVRDGFLLKVDYETSARMGSIGQRDTQPEVVVRKLLHALGFRFRVQDKSLPGRPDITNKRRKWAVFVHGCYWHHHHGCKLATVPSRNQEFWLAKFERNRHRDAQREAELRELGYVVVVVWQCETRNLVGLGKRLRAELPS
jgi:DNA mismatch endonuclease (patch repair protein)